MARDADRVTEKHAKTDRQTDRQTDINWSQRVYNRLPSTPDV